MYYNMQYQMGERNGRIGMFYGLEDVLGRQMDLVERGAVSNPIFREVAEQHCEVIYAAPVAKAS
jgi:hypothetical protein